MKNEADDNNHLVLDLPADFTQDPLIYRQLLFKSYKMYPNEKDIILYNDQQSET